MSAAAAGARVVAAGEGLWVEEAVVVVVVVCEGACPSIEVTLSSLRGAVWGWRSTLTRLSTRVTSAWMVVSNGGWGGDGGG